MSNTDNDNLPTLSITVEVGSEGHWGIRVKGEETNYDEILVMAIRAMTGIVSHADMTDKGSQSCPLVALIEKVLLTAEDIGIFAKENNVRCTDAQSAAAYIEHGLVPGSNLN